MAKPLIINVGGKEYDIYNNPKYPLECPSTLKKIQASMKPKKNTGGIVLALLALFGLPALAKATGTGGTGGGAANNDGDPPPRAADCRIKRGIRNNNPGNIPITAFPYLGKVAFSRNTDFNCETGKVERKYEQFVSYLHGVRALIQLTISQIYYDKGAFSVQEIVSKYPTVPPSIAPAYATRVAALMNVPVNEALATTENNIRALVKAIAYVENGSNVITDSQYTQALQIAPI